MDGKSIAELLCAERVSCTAGVPTGEFISDPSEMVTLSLVISMEHAL